MHQGGSTPFISVIHHGVPPLRNFSLVLLVALYTTYCTQRHRSKQNQRDLMKSASMSPRRQESGGERICQLQTLQLPKHSTDPLTRTIIVEQHFLMRAKRLIKAFSMVGGMTT